jgi:hypothetical protein
MEGSKLLNRKPKCTILESFDGIIIVIGPNIVKSNHKEIEKEENYHDGNIKGGA